MNKVDNEFKNTQQMLSKKEKDGVIQVFDTVKYYISITIKGLR